MTLIPIMTHPLSKHWEQPDSRNFIFDIENKTVAMNKDDFDKLHNYSCSIPSGVYEGKMWKANANEFPPNGDFEKWDKTPKWYLRWYDRDEDPNKCSIKTYSLIII